MRGKACEFFRCHFGKVVLAICETLVILGFTALLDSISVYIGPSPKEREKEK